MSKTEPTQSPAITRRPWYRLHFSTWLFAGLGLTVVVLLILPGKEGWYPWEGSLRQQRAVVHGWPWIYLWRTPRMWWDDPKASSSFAWDVGDSVEQFHTLPLIADIAVLAFSLAALCALWDWRRRRTSRLQFSLRSLLLFVTAVAVALGWWGVERSADEDVRTHMRSMGVRPTNLVSSQRGLVRLVPRFPLWTRIAVGDEQLLPLGLNTIEPMGIAWTRRGRMNVEYLVERFPKQVAVYLRDSDEHDLSDFKEIDATEHLVLWDVSDSVFDRLQSLHNLNDLSASGLTGHAVISLSGLAGLRSADLVRSTTINDAVWKEFAEKSNVESLSLHLMRLTDASLCHIAQMKRVRELDIAGSPISDEGIISLSANKSIVELALVETLITDGALIHLKSIPGLKWLDLSDTGVTDGGVSALQAARPDLEIKYHSEAPDLADLKATIEEVKSGKTTYFAVAGWKIQDRHLSELGELTGIESLALNAHHLTDATLARVESLQRLKELDVSSSLITGHGLRHLAKLPKLRTLTLDDRQVDDEALGVLKKLPTLKDVWIKHDLDDVDAKQLKARLKAALRSETGIKLHLDARSNSGSPWD